MRGELLVVPEKKRWTSDSRWKSFSSDVSREAVDLASTVS